MVLVWEEVQALENTACDLNLIRKDIADHFCLQLLFLARAATNAGGISSRYTWFSMNGSRLLTHLAHILTPETFESQLTSKCPLSLAYPGFYILTTT